MATHQQLKELSQEHLTKYRPSLSPMELATLDHEIDSLCPEFFLYQKKLLENQATFKKKDPLEEFFYSSEKKFIEPGLELLRNGKVGCLIVAGGQGSRLGFDGPKGMFPITPIKKKTLFQVFSEKVLAASRCYGYNFPLAIMTSYDAYNTVIEFFKENDYFGLKKENVFFFYQEELPLLDFKGNLFLERKDHIAQAPNGNGRALHLFYNSGIYQEWEKRGIDFLSLIQVDNPLIDPFDISMLGCHKFQENEITAKAILREESEIVGVYTSDYRVLEYTELSPEAFSEKLPDGKLKYSCGNISQFCFSLSWIKDLVRRNAHQELHLARKAVSYLNEEGITLKSKKPNAWKFEYFIFDVFSQAENISVIAYPSQDVFAPLKNTSGIHSIETVQAALLRLYKKTFQEISGCKISEDVFELDTQFLYPTIELLKKWQDQPWPENTTYLS